MFARWLGLFCVVSIVGCPGTSADVDGGALSCRGDPRVSAFSPDVQFSSNDGAIKASVVEGTPNPPSRGTNSWRVRLTEGSGNALTGLSLTADAFMPDHGHSASVRPTVTAEGDLYSVTPLSFFMPGVWRITLTSQMYVRSVALWYCVEG
ncbi:MAG: FixH family protein [Myxococcaceae bacterium]